MISWQIQECLAAHFRRQLSLSLFFLCRHGNICLTQHFANNSFCFGTLDAKELWHWFSRILGVPLAFFPLYELLKLLSTLSLPSYPFFKPCLTKSLFVSLPVRVLHPPGYHGCLSVLFVNRLYRWMCAFVSLSLSSHLSVSFIFLAIMAVCLSMFFLSTICIHVCVLLFFSHLSVSFIFLAIMVRNSGKSIVPLPSASTWVTTVEESLSIFIMLIGMVVMWWSLILIMPTSLIMSCSSASVGFWPRDLITCNTNVNMDCMDSALKKYNMEKSSRNRTLWNIYAFPDRNWNEYFMARWFESFNSLRVRL